MTPEMKRLAEEDTRRWLERAVIGLNLCPFAKSVYVKGQIHFAICDAADGAGLLAALDAELRALVATEVVVRDTTLLVASAAFSDFLDFNDFLADADTVLSRLGLDGIIQIAAFHPHFQFAGTAADDITNATNRAPYPTLHLIREDSIDRAVQAFPDAKSIYEVNMATLQRMGPDGWAVLDVGPHVAGEALSGTSKT